MPPFLMTKGSRGGLYALSRTDYELQKFDREGAYLGDFRPQPDENLTPPPDGVDAETRHTWAVTGQLGFNWLIPRGVAVAGGYLVVQFSEGPSSELRNHYFTLDGRPAFEQNTTRETLFGADEKGLLYFLVWGESYVVRAYSLAAE